MRIPNKYEIQKNHFPSTSRNYCDYSIFLIKYIDRLGNIEVETPLGSKKYKSWEDFKSLFHSKWNFTCTTDNELDALFRVFSRDQLIDLWLYHNFTNDGHLVEYSLKSSKIRLQVGKDAKTSSFLVNLREWCKEGIECKSLDILQKIVDEFLFTDSLLPQNPLSPASSTKDFMLANFRKDFYICNGMKLEDLKFLHSCYIGPRQESLHIGSREGIQDKDEVTSYLNELGRTVNTSQIKMVLRDEPYIPDAHMGSGYEAEFTVPAHYNKFPPIPKQEEGRGLIYPIGTFTTEVSKAYVDLAYERGDIGVKILHSVQGVTKKYPTHDFRPLMDQLSALEKVLKINLNYINTKNFHTAFLGHMISIYKVRERLDPNYINLKPLSYYQASTDYNPWLANAGTAMVACRQWRKTQVEEVEDIRVDCVSGRNLSKEEDCKLSDPGLSTSLTPHIRDKPGTDRYRHMIEKNRDSFRGINIDIEYRRGIRDSKFLPWRIGGVVGLKWCMPPLGGSRDLEFKGRMGELLEGSFETKIPQISTFGIGDAEFWEIYSILTSKI